MCALQIIILFRFLANKDEFEAHYQASLCKRLLTGKTASDETEMVRAWSGI